MAILWKICFISLFKAGIPKTNKNPRPAVAGLVSKLKSWLARALSYLEKQLERSIARELPNFEGFFYKRSSSMSLSVLNSLSHGCKSFFYFDLKLNNVALSRNFHKITIFFLVLGPSLTYKVLRCYVFFVMQKIFLFVIWLFGCLFFHICRLLRPYGQFVLVL